jgi:hypothetical protein
MSIQCNSNWTADREAQLKTLWEAGELSASEIAFKMGGFGHLKDGGRNAVIGKAHRMDLSARERRQADPEQSATLRKARLARAVKQKRMQRGQRRVEMGQPEIGISGKRYAPLPETAPFTGSLNIAFGDLRDFSGIGSNQCRYPTDELFCGVETPDGHSWCSHHRGIVFGYARPISEDEARRRECLALRFGNPVPAAVMHNDTDSLGARLQFR